MELEELSAANNSVFQEIGSEFSFVNTMGRGNDKFSNIPNEVEAYEDAMSEIFMERARFLLSTDELFEEMLSGSEFSFVNTMGRGNNKFSNIPHEIEAYEDALSEIFMERARFLLNTDEFFEGMLS